MFLILLIDNFDYGGMQSSPVTKHTSSLIFGETSLLYGVAQKKQPDL
jgi:hypothetical protein